jgi:hypothetical protein
MSSECSSVNNPYLITYAVNSITSGWGLNCGLGYTHEEVRNEDPFNPFKTTINDSEKILLGTEATYYYKWMKESRKGTDIPEETEKSKQFIFTVPIALFLMLKF